MTVGRVRARRSGQSLCVRDMVARGAAIARSAPLLSTETTVLRVDSGPRRRTTRARTYRRQGCMPGEQLGPARHDAARDPRLTPSLPQIVWPARQRLILRRRKCLAGADQARPARRRSLWLSACSGESDATPRSAAPRFSLPLVEDWPMIDRLQHEFEASASISRPIRSTPTARGCAGSRSSRYGELRSWLVGPLEQIGPKLAGIVLGRQERTAAKGNRFAFVQLSDASGMYEGDGSSPTRWRPRASCSSPARLVLLAADVAPPKDEVTRADRPVRAAASTRPSRTAAAGLKIFLRDPAPVDSLKKLIERERNAAGSTWCSTSIGQRGRDQAARRAEGDQRGDPRRRSRQSPASSTFRTSEGPRRRSGARKCPVDGRAMSDHGLHDGRDGPTLTAH